MRTSSPLQVALWGGAERFRDRAWALRLLPTAFLPSLMLSLLRGSFVDVLGLIGGTAVCWAGAALVESGTAAAAEYDARTLSQPPRLPRKLLGAALTGVGIYLVSDFASTIGTLPSILFGAVATLGTVLAYGTDPMKAKGIDPVLAERAGVRMETVIEAIVEAENKIIDIGLVAARLRNRELKDRLARIVERAQLIVREIEHDPGDIRRAQRFLVTYLDGTRDVVRKYAKQEQDLEVTPLEGSFRRLLETIETTFDEQLLILKRNESFDLEVKLEALHTQLKHEGVT